MCGLHAIVEPQNPLDTTPIMNDELFEVAIRTVLEDDGVCSLCREFGAGLYVSEMITARGYLNGNRLTQLLASSRPDESPRSVQIYGSDPVDVGEMARALAADGVEHIDMNFGCPVPKVTRHGGGTKTAVGSH